MKIILLISTLLVSVPLYAQNLIPNAQCEEYIVCPYSTEEIPSVGFTPTSITGWSRPTLGTSDYFNRCAGEGAHMSVPENLIGFQEPKSGDGYVGAIIHKQYEEGISDDIREYLQVNLNSELISGHTYLLSYSLSLAGTKYFMIEIDEVPVAIDRMGAYFSAGPEGRYTGYTNLADLNPQVESPAGVMLNDTTNWMDVSGTFTAAGGESWMIIGNFTEQEEVNYEFLGDYNSGYSYYYFDDFCLLDLSSAAATTSWDTVICDGFSISLQTPVGRNSFVWDDGSTAPTRTVTTTGAYWVRSVNTQECVLAVDTFYVKKEQTNIPIKVADDTVICSGNNLVLDALDSRFDQYRWNTGDTTSAITISEPGEYIVIAESECYASRDTVVVKSPPLPTAQLPEDLILCNGQPIVLANAVEAYTYRWSTGATDCCISINEPGLYSLNVTNECGDVASDDIVVSYIGCDNCILAPTAFSPNNDGLNDLFEPSINCLIDDFTIQIFNRWGQLVFTSYHKDSHWNGEVNGAPAELGVYFYLIEATLPIEGAKRIVKKGDITLLR